MMPCDECTSRDSGADEANAVAVFSAENLSSKIGAKRAFKIFGLTQAQFATSESRAIRALVPVPQEIDPVLAVL